MKLFSCDVTFPDINPELLNDTEARNVSEFCVEILTSQETPCLHYKDHPVSAIYNAF
jgi:hypothetical protein